MIADLRARARTLLDRPIPDDRRRRLAIACLALIAVGATLAVLAAPRRVDTSPQPSPPPPRHQATTAPSPVPPVSTTPAPVALGEEGTAPPGTSRRDVAAAKRAARRFLRVYLAYTHGRSQASHIPAATPTLRRRLAAAPPRVPPRERRRRARIEALQTAGVAADGLQTLALVSEGSRRYSVELTLSRDGGPWRVTELGGG